MDSAIISTIVSKMPDLQMIAVFLATIIVIVTVKFMIDRHLLYAKFMKRSGIPFLPITSYISGSWNSIDTTKLSLAEGIDSCHQITNSDTFGFFLGPLPSVVTQDLDLLYKVWVTDSVKHINKPDVGAVVPVVYNSLLLLPGDNWRRVRRAVMSTMTPAKLKVSDLEQDIDICLDNLLASLKKQLIVDKSKSLTVDSFKLFKDLTMDISLRSSVNQPDRINYLKENKIVSSAEKMMKEMMGAAIWTMFIPALTPIVVVLAEVLRLTKFMNYVIKAACDIIEDTKKKGKAGKTLDMSERRIIDSLLDVYDRKKITEDELVANTFIMMLAIWDTTGETLVVLMWFLAKNPQVQEKLRQSIITNGVDSEYLDWTIKEALRFNPPVNTFRSIGEEFKWKNYTLMKDVNLVMMPYLIHRNKKFWGDDVLEFRPERFEESDQFHPVQYCPFGLGPRNCVGYYMAISVLKQVMSRVILEYRIEPCVGTPEELKLKFASDAPMFLSVLRDHTLPLKFVKLV